MGYVIWYPRQRRPERSMKCESASINGIPLGPVNVVWTGSQAGLNDVDMSLFADTEGELDGFYGNDSKELNR